MANNPEIQNLSQLQIHLLSEDTYEKLKANQEFNETAMYLTPDLFPYDLFREGEGISSLVTHLSYIPGNQVRAFQPRATGISSFATGAYCTVGIVSLENLKQGLAEAKYELILDPTTGKPVPVAHAMALNYGTTAMGYCSTALNRGTWAIGDASFAINRATQAVGYETFAAGENTRAFGRFSLSLGRYSIAGGAAYQYDDNADGSRTYKLDENGQYLPIKQIADLIAQDPENGLSSSTNIPGDCAFAFGLRSFADASYSFAGGLQSKATGESAVALGRNALASGFTSIALGQGVEASGQNSIAIGLNTVASYIGSVAIGKGAKAGGDGAAAFNSAIASGQFSTAFGKATAAGTYSLAAGYEHDGTAPRATGIGSIALGAATSAEGQLSIAIGQGSYTESNTSYAFAGGLNSKVLTGATAGFAFGNNAQAQKMYSTAFGRAAYAQGNYSFTAGYYAFAYHDYSVAFGKYNAKTVMEKNVLLGYGAGTSNSARHNLFSVLADGDIVVAKDIYSNGGKRIPVIDKGTELPDPSGYSEGDIFILYED